MQAYGSTQGQTRGTIFSGLQHPFTITVHCVTDAFDPREIRSIFSTVTLCRFWNECFVKDELMVPDDALVAVKANAISDLTALLTGS